MTMPEVPPWSSTMTANESLRFCMRLRSRSALTVSGKKTGLRSNGPMEKFLESAERRRKSRALRTPSIVSIESR